MVISPLVFLTSFHPYGQETRTVLRPTAPCGVFTTEEEIVFVRSDPAEEALACAVLDYDQQEVWCSEVAGTRIQLPPLGPGYYELRWKSGGKSGVNPFGVVRARPNQPPPDGPLAVDGAIAWLCTDEQWEPIAQMLRKVGIGWMRERLSWGQVNPERGKLEWGKYETVADILYKQGVREYQIFHDSPSWTHPGKQTRCPDDLREVYRFTKEASAHFAGRILAWEPWNEPDISFFDQLGDKYAGLQKAAYLGFKAGNSNVLVLSCSFCRGRSPFSDNVFESGLGAYMDIFNFHTYAPIAHYEDNLASWIGLTRTYRVSRRPIWLTEAGIRLVAADGETLSREQERAQAEFVPRSFATSLASGVDKHFFFVLPFYPEHGVQFGALHRDLSPRPALLAIATAVRVLGKAKYLGRIPLNQGSARVQLFDSGAEMVGVAWADEPTEIRLPIGTDRVRVVDLVGRETQVAAENGVLSLRLGPSAQYLVGMLSQKGRLLGKVRSPGKVPALRPSKVVLVGYCDSAAIDKDLNHYLIAADRPSCFVVDVYNFDEKKAAIGCIRVILPPGWSADNPSQQVRLGPMGRQTIRLLLKPKIGVAASGITKIRVEGEFEGERVMPSVSYVRVNLATLTPTRRLDLGLNRVEAWEKNIPGYGRMEVIPGEDGGVAFPITFIGSGDRWCYPRVRFSGVRDWRRYQAIAFEYRFDTDDDTTTARVQVIESGGPSYLCNPHPATREWRRVVAAFSDLTWGSFSPADPNRKLDLDRVAAILIGCNTVKMERLTFEVRNVELLGFD